jgi:hypothetical protein
MFRFSWSDAMRVGALIGVLGGLMPSQAAAEIYGWVDASGSVTYSNLPPPKNARVVDVIPETPPPSPQAMAAAEAAHQSEMRALNEKVRQIELERQQARSAAAYPAGAPPSYGPPPSYGQAPSYGPAASYDSGCDAAYYDCDLWDGPAYYNTGFLPFWGFRPHHDRDHDRDGFRHGSHRFPHPGGGAPRFAAVARPAGGGSHMSGGHGHAGASSGPVAHR